MISRYSFQKTSSDSLPAVYVLIYEQGELVLHG